MSCNGKCESCPHQCGRSLLKTIENAQKQNQPNNPTGKEQEKMSENVLNCSSGEKERMTAHAAWIDATKKAITILAAILSMVLVVAYIVTENIKDKLAEVELRHTKAIAELATATSIRIQNLEKEVQELKDDCKQAERDYTSARVALHRASRNKK